MDEKRLEVKVGALALVALAIAVLLVLGLTGLRGGSLFAFHVDLGFAGGLPSGAVVKIAGVKVGRVTEVALRPEGRDADGAPLPVRLTVEVDRAAARALRDDTSASVATQGALGETYLEVLPGRGAGALAENSTVRGIDPPRLDVLLARVSHFFEDAQNDDAFRNFLVEVARLAHTVDGAMGQNRQQILEFFRDVSSTLEVGRRTVQDAHLAVQDARGALQDVRVAARSASALLGSPEIKGLVTDLAEASKTARAELPKVLGDTRLLVANLEKTAGAMTPADVEKIKATLAKYDALAATLQKVTTSADAILVGVQKGEGTAGQLVKDPKAYQDLRELLDDLKKHPWKFVWKD